MHREPPVRGGEVVCQDGLEDAQVLGDRAVDTLGGEEVVHAHRPDPFIDHAEQPGERTVAGRLSQPDVEALVEQDEARVGLRGVLAEHPPVVAQRFDDRQLVPLAQLRRSGQCTQLERLADLVQLAHLDQVGRCRQVPAVGQPVDQPLGVQPYQRLAYRRTGDREQRGQAFLAESDPQGELT